MSGIAGIIVLVLVLALGACALGARYLLRTEAAALRQGRGGLQALLLILALVPIVGVGIVWLLYSGAWQSEGPARIAHGLFALGLWMPAALLVLLMGWMVAQKRRVSTTGFLGLALILAAAIIFIPFSRFEYVFTPDLRAWALALGAAGVVETYALLAAVFAAARRPSPA